MATKIEILEHINILISEIFDIISDLKNRQNACFLTEKLILCAHICESVNKC